MFRGFEGKTKQNLNYENFDFGGVSVDTPGIHSHTRDVPDS